MNNVQPSGIRVQMRSAAYQRSAIIQREGGTRCFKRPAARAAASLQPYRSCGRSALCALLALLGSSAAAQSDVDRFIWDQANTQMIHAAHPDDYLKAAQSYSRLLQNGVVNAPLLINLGTALTLGGDTRHARAAFERAELYSGTTPEIRNGLIAALTRQKESTGAELPWHRTAFFWHYGIPARLRIIIALCGWSLLWTGILFYSFRKRSRHRPLQLILTLAETCMIAGSLIFLIFAASSVFTLLQERQSRSQWAAPQFSRTILPAAEEVP